MEQTVQVQFNVSNVTESNVSSYLWNWYLDCDSTVLLNFFAISDKIYKILD